MTFRLGISARTLNAEHLRGTGRYVQELLRNTQPADDVHWTAFGHDPARPFMAPAPFSGSVDIFPFRGDRFELWEQVGLPLRLRRNGIQLLHCAENTVPLWQPVPTVVTIHDTVLWTEKRPTRLDWHYLHHVQSLAYRWCAGIVTISESSRRDIAERWPVLADRITVIPHGIADEFFAEGNVGPPPEGLQRSLGRSPYLLYIGGSQPRKRFGWALELLAACSRDDLHLVACGFGASHAVPGGIPPALRARVHFAPFVSDAQLVGLYQRAEATVYPTLYEGFGFPAVESQAAGTPVLFSPVSSLVDLVGPMAWPLPIDDFNAWRAAIEQVLVMPAHVRAERAHEAREWARKFAWRRSVERHLELFRGILAAQRG